MQKIFDALLAIIEIAAEFAASKKIECLLIFILCFLSNIILYPQGAINRFMIHLIDIIFLPLPSTPENWKLANILADFAASNPHVGWGILWEIIQMPLGLLALFLAYKVIVFVKW